MENGQFNNSPGMNGMAGAGPMPGSPMPGGDPAMTGAGPSTMPGDPAMAGVPAQPGATQYQTGPNGMPMVQQMPPAPEPIKEDKSGKAKTLIIIILSIVLVVLVGIFLWILMDYTSVKTDVEGQIATAVAEAKDQQAKQLEKEHAEQEKNPYKIFVGPEDYGQLTFEYPRTWSVYVAAAATKGGDFNAYFNPIQVDAIGKETINALRVTIQGKSFDDVAQEYQKVMDKKNSNLTMDAVMIGKDRGITANFYTGTIPSTELSGYIVIFKIRGQTVTLQTDSVLFKEDFDRLLGTIEFND